MAFNSGDMDPYEVLGIESGDSISDVKRKYKELFKQYHPDRLPPEKRDEAHLKAVELNSAMDYFRQFKGEIPDKGMSPGTLWDQSPRSTYYYTDFNGQPVHEKFMDLDNEMGHFESLQRAHKRKFESYSPQNFKQVAGALNFLDYTIQNKTNSPTHVSEFTPKLKAVDEYITKLLDEIEDASHKDQELSQLVSVVSEIQKKVRSRMQSLPRFARLISTIKNIFRVKPLF